MTRGTIGFQGFGRRRALEFPNGEQAAVAPPGRARLRYNDSTGQLELSISGGAFTPLGGGAAAALSYAAWVDQRSGNDGTAVVGNISLPFATVQAAVNAVIALANPQASILILPGDYQEDVVVPGAFSDVEIGFAGVSGASNIRSLTLNAPAAVAARAQFTLNELTLGTRVGGGQTVAPLVIVNDAGNTDVYATQLQVFTSTPNIDLIRTENAAAFGFLVLQLNGGQVFAQAGATNSRALFLQAGTLLTNDVLFFSQTASCVEFDGFVALFDIGSVFQQSIGSVPPLVTCTPTAIPFVNVYGTSLQLPTVNTVFDLPSPVTNVNLNSGVIQSFVHSGAGIITPGTASLNYITDLGGNRLSVSALSGVNELQGAELVAYDSTTNVLPAGLTATEGIDRAIQGVSDTVPRVTGGGATLAGTEEIILVDEPAVATTILLPLRSTVDDGKKYRIVDATPAGSAGLTVASSGADTINGGPSVVVTSGQNNYVEVMAEAGAATSWVVVGLRP